jgi:hypothetical protein
MDPTKKQHQILSEELHLSGQRKLLENVRRLHLELWRQRKWLFHQSNAPYLTSFFAKEILTKTIRLPPPTALTLLFPQLKIKPCDTTKLIGADSAAALDILEGHCFHMHSKNGASAAYSRKRGTSVIMVAGVPKVSF